MTVRHREVAIQARRVVLEGELALPAAPLGLVVFAHGSGSSRRSPRNRQVADALHGARFGTLLFDLLTPEEQEVDLRTRHLRFDIGLLADRLTDTLDWLARRKDAGELRLGLFGASTGAAAALVAAARRPGQVAAVVSRGGRPDLAGDALTRVKAPTLLLVGSRDAEVIALNEAAAARLAIEHRVTIVPGAGHLFEEPGTMEEVVRHAADWFHLHVMGPAQEEGQA